MLVGRCDLEFQLVVFKIEYVNWIKWFESDLIEVCEEFMKVVIQVVYVFGLDVSVEKISDCISDFVGV